MRPENVWPEGVIGRMVHPACIDLFQLILNQRLAACHSVLEAQEFYLYLGARALPPASCFHTAIIHVVSLSRKIYLQLWNILTSKPLIVEPIEGRSVISPIDNSPHRLCIYGALDNSTIKFLRYTL